MTNTNFKSTLYVDADKLYYYTSGLKKPLVFSYPSKTVSDLEIINTPVFEKNLKEFISKELKPSKLLIILSPKVTFQKSFTPETESKRSEFLDSIPFENVASRYYVAKEKKILVAANRDFFQQIQKIFTGEQFLVDAIIPETAFPKKFEGLNLSGAAGLDPVIGNYDLLSNLSLSGNSPGSKPEIVNIADKQIKESKNLKPLIIFFILALFILGGAYIYSQKSYVETSPVAQTPTVTPESTTSVIQTPEKEATPSITIYYSPSKEQLAKQLQNSFWSSGFKDTEVAATTSAIPKNILNISPELPADIAQKIRETLSKFQKFFNTAKSDTVDAVTIFLAP